MPLTEAGTVAAWPPQPQAPLPHPSGRAVALVTGYAECRPCHLRDCPIDHRCMKRISVDRVFDSVAARLQR